MTTREYTYTEADLFDNVPMVSGWTTIDIAQAQGWTVESDNEAEAVEYLNTLCSPNVRFILDEDCLILEEIEND
tara:strand:+ start:2131 stop:2352 length:222 start_codon:yes stop_codon:yes gene_type:complete